MAQGKRGRMVPASFTRPRNSATSISTKALTSNNTTNHHMSTNTMHGPVAPGGLFGDKPPLRMKLVAPKASPIPNATAARPTGKASDKPAAMPKKPVAALNPAKKAQDATTAPPAPKAKEKPKPQPKPQPKPLPSAESIGRSVAAKVARKMEAAQARQLAQTKRLLGSKVKGVVRLKAHAGGIVHALDRKGSILGVLKKDRTGLTKLR